MASSFLIPSVLVVDPASPHNGHARALRMSAGSIVDIGDPHSLSAQPEDEVLSLPPSARVSPGWVDMQAHLQDPGHEYKETMAALAAAAASGGFVDVLCYPDTEPALDQAQLLEGLQQRSSQLPVNLHLCGHLTEHGQGQELAELFDMQQAGAAAFTHGLERLQDAGVMLRVMRYLKRLDRVVILSPLETRLVPEGQMNESPQSVRLGMRGIPEVAESMAVVQDLELLRYVPGRVHIQPLSAPRALQQISKARQAESMDISVGVPICYLIHSDEELDSFDSMLKVMPPLRSPAQREALRQALKQGEIDVLTTGHRAQGMEEKQVEFSLAEPGMLALQTFYPLALQLIAEGCLTEADLIRHISQRPREILGWEPLLIEEGASAQLTFFDPEASWTLTAADIPSRAKNSPYLGQRLTGKVLGIMRAGQWTAQA